jgi:ribosomal protein S18 acetylase RimI-like enzyme
MIRVRVGTEADAALAAQLHASEISEGFLPTLGVPFLERLYRRIVRSPGSFLLVAEHDVDRIGFVAGTDDVRALYHAFLWHDGIAAATSALPRVVRSWRRVLETFRYGVAGESESSSVDDDHDDATAAELLAIAVAPTERGRGAGHALLEAFTGELSVRRIERARVVVGADNASAIALYQHSGFRSSARIEVHRGTSSQVLTWP